LKARDKKKQRGMKTIAEIAVATRTEDASE
jgi:hypothetical protein